MRRERKGIKMLHLKSARTNMRIGGKRGGRKRRRLLSRNFQGKRGWR